MDFTIDSGGNLVMVPDVNDAQDLRELKDKQATETEEAWLIENGFDLVLPEEIGALTSAPIVSYNGEIYAYMDYQVKSFLEEMAEGREVTWVKG